MAEKSSSQENNKLNPLEWTLSIEFVLGIAVIILTVAGFAFEKPWSFHF